MSRFVLTPAADQDLNDIWDYIAATTSRPRTACSARSKRHFTGWPTVWHRTTE